MSSTVVKNHFVALDSLRGISASIVVFFHVDGDAAVRKIPFVANGFLFVDFFFVLSGFVIAASYGEKLINEYSIGKFMFLRWGRLYPLHAFMLLAYLCLALGKYLQGAPSNYPISEFFSSALLLQAWEPHFGMDLNHWNPPSWSISAEFWTYLIFALTSRIVGRHFLIAIASLIVITVPMLLFGSDRVMNVCFTGSGIARCVYGFSFGVIAYSIWRSGALDVLKDSLLMITLTEIIAIFCTLALVSYAGSRTIGLLCPLAFSLTVIVVAYQGGAISRFLTSAPLVLIGTLSYSIYMTHEFALARFCNVIVFLSSHFTLPITIGADGFTINNAPGWNAMADVAAVAFYVTVLFVSYATYRLVENPMRLWSREIVNRGKKTKAAEVFNQN
jgi:peptidoglycan/LPS O-acetylase OafA/YrhL